MSSPASAQPAGSPDATAFRDLLRRHGIRPDKRLGQHFLFEPGALDRVVRAAELESQDTVLEIGAGVGSLTLRLAEVARNVVAVEVDDRLLPALREATAAYANVRLIRADILSLDVGATLAGSPYLVVANIPYQITSILIRRLLEAPFPASRLVLTVQREVAERIVALAGEMSLLALSVQLYGMPSVAGNIPAGSFYPPPRVDSAILRVDCHATPRIPRRHVPSFFRLARAGFGQKRKQLKNALSAGLALPPATVVGWLLRAGIRPESRAQELRLEDWMSLLDAAREVGVEVTKEEADPPA